MADRRRLTKTEAVKLAGWPPDIFDRKVADGVYPRPLREITPQRKRPVVLFDRKALEQALDREAGISPQLSGPDPDDLLEDYFNDNEDSARSA